MRTFDPHRPFAFPKSRRSIVGQGHDRALSNQASRRASEKIVKRLNFGMSDRNLSDFRLHLFKSPSAPVKQGAIKFEVQHLPRVRCAHARKNPVSTASV